MIGLSVSTVNESTAPVYAIVSVPCRIIMPSYSGRFSITAVYSFLQCTGLTSVLSME